MKESAIVKSHTGLEWVKLNNYLHILPRKSPMSKALSFNFKKHFWVKRWKRITIWSLSLKDLNLRLSVSSTKVGSSKVFWTVNEQKISEKRLQICNFNGYGFTTGSLVGILRNILSFYRKLLLKYAVMIKLIYAFCFYFCIFIFFFQGVTWKLWTWFTCLKTAEPLRVRRLLF